MSKCQYCHEDHCTIGIEFIHLRKESETCQHEDKNTRIFNIIGTGLCMAKDGDLATFCPDCDMRIDDLKGCKCDEAVCES